MGDNTFNIGTLIMSWGTIHLILAHVDYVMGDNTFNIGTLIMSWGTIHLILAH